ncbi:MAG: VWA domain-containing protein [Candidatus Omnitrophica bacterium]|nr:VWA domain-containing protein [Candidatus Omnitrophota bacterium]
MIRILRPEFLFLLFLIPAAWYMARRIRVLGKGRKAVALALRTLVLLFFILTLAEVELVDKGESLTVLFAIDRSTSVPADQQQFSLAYVQDQLMKIPEGDSAGILFFGKEAVLEENPGENVTLQEYQAILNAEGTDIEAAINLGMAAFPEGAQKRIVLITDGNQTQGDAIAAAQRAAANGIDLRIMPLQYASSQEVLVEDISIPNQIQEKEPFKIRVIVNAQEAGPGVLRITENDQVIVEESVDLRPGKNAYWIPRSIEQAGVYTYTAVLEAENDRRPSNNRAQNFAFVKGTPHVLLIDPAPEEASYLTAALTAEGIQVDLQTPEGLPGTLRELQMYDSVVLSNAPAADFSTSQLQMLETAASDLGVGLVMIGGPDSFGAGGYQDTPVEKALPVSMDVKQRRIIPSGALVLILHSCEIPQGNYWAQEIAKAALDSLSRNDYIGVLRYSSGIGESWLFPLEMAGNKRKQKTAIDGLAFGGMGDMPSFASTMEMALKALTDKEKVQANIKHMVILSDGDPARPSQALIDSIVEANISISTVCINPHGQADVDTMFQLAKEGKGNAYHVKNNRNLPRIFTKEAMTVRRNLILEETFTPQVTYFSEVLQGFEEGFPALEGYVVTSPKSGAETVLITHKKDPLLAHWRYGLGKTAAFTSDAKARWGSHWLEWDNYARFWSQLVRWTLRTGRQDQFQIQTSVEGDRVKCIVDALTDEGGFLNELAFNAAVIDPKYQTKDFEMRQTEPGRYMGYFPTNESGSYLISMTYEGPDGMEGSLTSGASIPYSPEHTSTRQNDLVLKQLTDVSGNEYLTAEAGVFEHNLKSTGDMLALWPYFLGAAICLFFFDIAVRRVFFELTQLQNAAAKARDWIVAPFRLKPAPAGPATQEIGSLMQAKQRAAEDTAYAKEKESLIRRLEAVKESDLEELESVRSKPEKEAPLWQEAKKDEGPEKFEDEPADAYTSALFKAKSRAKGNLDKRR